MERSPRSILNGARISRRWRDVMPPTTTQTMRRTDGNYAAWSDFKGWMDVAYARAIKAGAQAVHTGAPWARAAIEGAQMPGWGGYDYRHLAPAVDVMELYDAGQSLDLAQAFNPHLSTLMTVNWARPGALHRSWREFLRGVRGMVVWDPNDRFVNPDGSLGPDGRIAAPFLAAMQKGPASLILASRRARAPIAVLYSPESYRLQWLLDHRAMGASWTRLGSEDENADNAVRAARRRVLGLLERLGLSPHFVSEKEIAERQLEQAHDKIVILPQTLALSGKAARAIRTFIRSGGVLVTAGQTGHFDGHGRRLARPRLSALLDGKNRRAISLSNDDADSAPSACSNPESSRHHAQGDDRGWDQRQRDSYRTLPLPQRFALDIGIACRPGDRSGTKECHRTALSASGCVHL